MLPKVADVSRIQVNEQQQSLAAMQSKTQSVEKQSEENMRQVNSQKEPTNPYQRKLRKKRQESKQKTGKINRKVMKIKNVQKLMTIGFLAVP